ncbi:MAG: ATP-binding protein [Rhodospirillaceae bacterium]
MSSPAPSQYAALTGSRFVLRLVVIAILFDLAIGIFAGWWLYQGRLSREKETETATKNLCEVLEESISGFISKVDAIIFAASDYITEEKSNGGIDKAALNAYLERYASLIPTEVGFRVSNAQGITEYGMQQQSPPPQADVSDREHFMRVRDDLQAGLTVSAPVFGRDSGKWLLILSRRINNKDGSFGGEVRASVGVDYFFQKFSTLDVGSHGVISLRNSELALITRFPKYQGVTINVGDKSVSQTKRDLIKTGRRVATYYSPAGPDGIARTVTYRRISNYPLYIIVGQAIEDYMSDWHADVVKVSGLVAVLWLVTFAAVWLEYCGWRNRVSAAEALEHNTAEYTAAITRAKDEVDAIRQNLNAILSAAGEAIIGFDRDGRVTFLNPATTRMAGWEADDLIGKDQHSTLHSVKADGTPYPDEDCPILGVMLDRIPRHITNEVFCRRDGSVFPVEYTATPIDNDGIVTGAVTVFRDITERIEQECALKLAWKAAEAANLAKSRFLANMSHEFRTPLHTIMGFSEVLMDMHHAMISDQRLIEYAGDIHSSASHLLSVVNDVLDIAKIEAGRIEIERTKISICRIIQGVIRLFSEAAHKVNVTLDAAKISDDVELWADERAVKQILFNLISNAIKFSRKGGTVTIETMAAHDGFDVSVSDTGIGIPADQIDRIFLPFEQIDNRYSRSENGTGLGLSVVRGLVDLHGGRLSIHSVVGSGTVISIHFPNVRY